MHDDFEKISKNIHDLRILHGETQEELGRKINVERNTISMYEKGKRQPDMQIIKKLADHYGLSVDQFISDDFSDMNYGKFPMTWGKMISFFNEILPIVCSEKAMNDTFFMSGYKKTQRIWLRIKNASDFIMSSDFENALDEYSKSIEFDLSKEESAANMLWLIFVYYFLLPDEHSIKMGEAILFGNNNSKDFIKQYVLKDSNPISAENLKNKKDYICENHSNIVYLIQILKESSDYADLGDYYIALRYIMGLCDNGCNDDLNKTIGREMMVSYAEIGNRYALNYFHYIYFEESI